MGDDVVELPERLVQVQDVPGAQLAVGEPQALDQGLAVGDLIGG